MEHFFRYYEINYSSGPRICLQKFPVLRKTSKGTWIDKYGTPKFVLDGEGKRYAWPTIELAQKSYIRRKERHVHILTAQLKYAQKCLDLANAGKFEEQREPLSLYDFLPE